MARATFVRQARKPNPVVTQEDIDKAKAGVAGAASYWHWSFRFGPKCYSKTRPRPSQLTQSEYLQEALALDEEIQDTNPEGLGLEDLEDLREGWASRARDIGGECQSRLYNMPESLQYSDAGQLLEERVEAMDRWADELEGVDLELGDGLPEDEQVEAALGDLQAATPDIC